MSTLTLQDLKQFCDPALKPF